MKHLTLTPADQMQLFTVRLGLKTVVESEGRWHLTNPVLVRRCATLWLSKAGFKVTNRTRWATLHDMFESTFGRLMDEVARQRAEDKAGEQSDGVDPSLN